MSNEQTEHKPNVDKQAGVDPLVILPCPFCGSTDIVVSPKMYHGSAIEIRGSKFWRVECLPCDARTGDNFDDDAKLFGFKDGREMAIKAWNIRAY